MLIIDIHKQLKEIAEKRYAENGIIVMFLCTVLYNTGKNNSAGEIVGEAPFVC